jgi:hypothetical protein
MEMAERTDVQKVREYVAQVDGAPWADQISDEAIKAEVERAMHEVRVSGRQRGWLGVVHARLALAYGDGPDA